MISALQSGAMRVSLTIGVPPTMSARLTGIEEFWLPFGTGVRLSTRLAETASCEAVGGGERRDARFARFLEQVAHGLLDPSRAGARLGGLVAVQLERDVDDPARVGNEVRGVEDALGRQVVRQTLVGQDVVGRA